MLEPEAFARMRLGDFLPPQDITTLSDWEYLERLWVTAPLLAARGQEI